MKRILSPKFPQGAPSSTICKHGPIHNHLYLSSPKSITFLSFSLYFIFFIFPQKSICSKSKSKIPSSIHINVIKTLLTHNPNLRRNPNHNHRNHQHPNFRGHIHHTRQPPNHRIHIPPPTMASTPLSLLPLPPHLLLRRHLTPPPQPQLLPLQLLPLHPPHPVPLPPLAPHLHHRLLARLPPLVVPLLFPGPPSYDSPYSR